MGFSGLSGAETPCTSALHGRRGLPPPNPHPVPPALHAPAVTVAGMERLPDPSVLDDWSAPPEAVAPFAACDDSRILLKLAEHPHTPDLVLLALFCSEDPHVRAAALCNSLDRDHPYFTLGIRLLPEYVDRPDEFVETLQVLVGDLQPPVVPMP